MLPVASNLSFSCDNAIHYALPVLWVTFCSHLARSVDSIDVGAMLQQVVINFQRIRQGAPCCLTMSSYTIAAIAHRRRSLLSVIACSYCKPFYSFFYFVQKRFNVFLFSTFLIFIIKNFVESGICKFSVNNY